VVLRGISQSALSLYRYCAYAYKLRYINKCESMFFDTSILDVGAIVHDSIDKYYVDYYLIEGTSDDILAEVYDLLSKRWDKTFLPEQLQQAYICIENFSKWEYNNLLKKMHTKPLTEQKIDSNGYYGIIDYIDLQNRNVIDWKTGTNAYISYEYRMQAHVYKILFENKFNMKINEFYFFFLYPNTLVKIDYNDKKQIKVGEETDKLKDELVESLKSGNFDKCPRTAMGCKNCLLSYYCQIKEW
jgi:CRISPR/Cas system-associated exonuclease Cas4 (RecB family)